MIPTIRMPLRNRLVTLATTTVAILSHLTSGAHAASWIGIGDSNLRNGNVDFGTIPLLIVSVTNYLMGFVGTVSMMMIIYGAVRMGFGVVTGDKEIGKKVIAAGIIGFVIAVSGWFIVNLIIDNF
jgi:Type IV secretion system pilin